MAAETRNKALRPWVPDLINHFWYCCRTAQGKEDVLVVSLCREIKDNTILIYHRCFSISVVKRHPVNWRWKKTLSAQRHPGGTTNLPQASLKASSFAKSLRTSSSGGMRYCKSEDITAPPQINVPNQTFCLGPPLTK